MRDLLSWNLYVGRVAGIQLRLHAFFVVVAGLVLLQAQGSQGEHFPWHAPVGLAALLTAILLHECGHSLAAQQLGGQTDVWLIWPLGGLALPTTPRLPYYEVRVAAAGPLANGAACLALAPLLWLAGVGPGEVMHPLVPPAVGESLHLRDVVKQLFWCNWLVGLVNLLPAQPLDGGRMYRALLWHLAGLRSAKIRLAKLGQVMALGLGVTAWVVRDELPESAPWCLALAGLLFFSSRQETERLHEPEPEELPTRTDFGPGGVALQQQVEPSARPQRLGLLQSWLAQRRQQRQSQRRQQEQQDEQKLDEILGRLHEHGPGSLSEEDRLVLKRSSARYRDRLGR